MLYYIRLHYTCVFLRFAKKKGRYGVEVYAQMADDNLLLSPLLIPGISEQDKIITLLPLKI